MSFTLNYLDGKGINQELKKRWAKR